MSNTYKEKLRNKFKREHHKADKKADKLLHKLIHHEGWSFHPAYHKSRKIADDPFDILSSEDQSRLNRHWKTPSWFHRLFNRKPKRRQDRDLLRKVQIDSDSDDLVFTNDKKPAEYCD